MFSNLFRKINLCKMWYNSKCHTFGTRWEGHVSEFSNTTPLPAKIYANEGVAQFVFIRGNETKPYLCKEKRKIYEAKKGYSPKSISSSQCKNF